MTICLKVINQNNLLFNREKSALNLTFLEIILFIIINFKYTIIEIVTT